MNRTLTAPARSSLIGAIVEDTSVESRPRYAVGERGFLCLDTGTWLPYDSAFEGPGFFAAQVFAVVLPAPSTQQDQA